MSQDAQEKLERYIETLSQGAPAGDSINNQPGLSMGEIGLLRLAEQLSTLGEEQVPTKALEESRTRLLAHAAALSSRANMPLQKPEESNFLRKIIGVFTGLKRLSPTAVRLAIILGITALLLVFSSGLVVTSAKSIPGEPLYRVKRVVEEIKIQLVPGSENKQEFEESFNQIRVGEVRQLIERSKVQQISFEGVLEEVSQGSWVVDGITVIIQDSTIFVGGSESTGGFLPGSVVEIEGTTTTQGTVNASEVHLREYLFQGIVEQIGQSNWTVSGSILTIKPSTEIDEDIKVGDRVAVWVHSTDSGSYAVSIEKEGVADATPENESEWQPSEGNDANQTDEYEAGEVTAGPGVIETQKSGEAGDDEHATITVEPPGTDESSTQTVEPPETEEHEDGTVTPDFEQTPEPTESNGG